MFVGSRPSKVCLVKQRKEVEIHPTPRPATVVGTKNMLVVAHLDTVDTTRQTLISYPFKVITIRCCLIKIVYVSHFVSTVSKHEVFVS